MEKLNINAVNLDMILDHMENQTPPYAVYIDLDTGRLALGEGGELSSEELEGNPDRYCSIPTYPPWAGYRIMEKFARSEVEDEDVSDLLFEALSGKKPFRRFRDVLHGFPRHFARFEDYKQQVMIDDFKYDLAQRGYELVLPEKPPPGDAV